MNHYHHRSSNFPNSSNDPVTSYGLIIYCVINCITYFLIQQRRDTFEYTDFIRGIWKNFTQVVSFFSLMSLEERTRIREFTFQELWDDLFVDKTSRMYKEAYVKAKKKYDSIKHMIPNILDTTQHAVTEPPWGFPKGKKNGYNESDMECAVRESEEETTIKSKSLEIVSNKRYSEQFTGTNGKLYATHYFLSKVKLGSPNPIEIKRVDTPKCIREDTVSEEASDVKWVTYAEALPYLNHQRQQLLGEAFQYIQRMQ